MKLDTGMPRLSRQWSLWGAWLRGPCLTAIVYYLGAQAAFLIGTLSDRIFAPFWPPNVVLFCALLLAPYSRWYLYILAVFPAHTIAEIGVGMPADQLLVAFATNCMVALLSATAVRQILGDPPWFNDVRRACAFIGITAFASPALSALGGAFVPILGGGSVGDYWAYWWHWLFANTLVNLTLGPMFLVWYVERTVWPLTTSVSRRVEAAVLAVALAIVSVMSFDASASFHSKALVPALSYAPLPLVLWAAIRFGATGASGAILVVTIGVISQALRGPSPFDGVNLQMNVLSLQLFLTGLSVPVLLLGALIDQLSRAQEAMRELARSVLHDRDDERRRVARELHENTGQNLIAAMMGVGQLERTLPASASKTVRHIEDLMQRSISDLRTVSYLLHPPLLDEGGLTLALRNYVNGYAERHHTEVDFFVSPGLKRLPQEVELALFRVAQEGMALIHHQSGGRSMRVHLKQRAVRDGEFVNLTIDDLDEDAPSEINLPMAIGRHLRSEPVSGMWATGMRERMHHIGGHIEISSGMGRTIVNAVVPVK